MLSGWEFPSLMRKRASQKGRLRRPGHGFRSPSLGLWGRWRLLGEPTAGFQAGSLRSAAKVAVAVFVVFDLILVYRLTANDPPAVIANLPGDVGAHTVSSPSFVELREALRNLSLTMVSALTLTDGDAGGTRHSTKRTGGDTPHETSPSSGLVADSGTAGSATNSGSGGSATGSGSASGSGSSGGSSEGGGPGGGGLPGGGSGEDGGTGGTGGGGGGGGGP